MKLLIKIIFFSLLYSCDNYCGCCCNCFRWNKDDENIKNNEVKDENKNIEEEVDKIIKKEYKEITDEEFKKVVKEILLIEKYGSCIVCKDTTEDTSSIRDNYDFGQNQYTYSYDSDFNYRYNHICMSMLTKSNKSEDSNKILGNLYRKGVIGFILKPESDSYLIGDGFINYQRKDSMINVHLDNEKIEYIGCNDCNFIENTKDYKEYKEGDKKYDVSIFHHDYDDLLKSTSIDDKIKKSKRIYLEIREKKITTSGTSVYRYLFTNLSLLLAKDDEKCYRLKDNITQDDDSHFVKVNLEDTLSTEIKIVGEEENSYYDNIFFYKPTKNFFKNACNTGCLNSEVKVYKLEEQEDISWPIEYNEIPIVPINKVNNNNSDKIKYPLECIDLFVDMRKQNVKYYFDKRMVEHYNKALNLLEKKNKKYVIVLTDEYFVIDTVENLLEYFKDKEEVDIFSKLDIAKKYKINYDIDFNKRYKTEN